MNDTPDRAAEHEPVVIEVTVGAPIETVWSYLRDTDLISRWHGWLDEGLDEEIDYIYRRHARESPTPYVLEMDRATEGPWVDGGDRFELFVTEGPEAQTTVRITRGARGSEQWWDATWYDDVTEGWTSFLNQLRFTLEVQPETPRRTVFLNVDGVRLTSVRSALGLSGVAPEAPYAADGGGDLDLRGRGWFVAEHQVGVTVDSLGPGLVVAADKPDPTGASKGAMVIVSTYGQDDAAFDRTVQQWADWWQAHYPGAKDPQT